MKIRLWGMLAAGWMGTMGMASAGTAATNQWQANIYGLAERFEWQETMGGREFVKETGPRYGGGLRLAVPFNARVGVEALGEMSYGQIDYSGYLQLDNPNGPLLVPYTSKTTYTGGKGEANFVVYLPASAALQVQPFAGAGARLWKRELGTGTDEDRQYGYTEYWTTAYANLGVGLVGRVTSRVNLFGRITLRFPFYNNEKVDMPVAGGTQEVTLKPGKKSSLYAEAGADIYHGYVALFYEELKFAASEADPQTEIMQPQSEAQIFGLKAGLVF